jgi:hypothetical protein
MRVLKIESLPPAKEWIDRDEIMLHSCFQLLKDCVEKEKVDTDCDYEANKEFVDEVQFLYNWWIKRSKDAGPDNQNEDNDMLLRLMKIRTSLWT